MRKLILAVLLALLPAAGWAQSVGAGSTIEYFRAPTSPEILLNNATDSTTVGTSEEVLATLSLTAGKMANDGDALRVSGHYVTATNGNTKLVRVRLGGIGGSIIYTKSAADNNLSIEFHCTVWRTSATVQRGMYDYLTSGGSAAAAAAAAGNQTMANALTLVVTGTTVTAGGDVTLKAWQVEYLPAK